MPTEVLNQLRVLRETIAEALRQDPRYLTLAALDKSISEISDVLDKSGAASAVSAPRPPLQFEAPAPHAVAAEKMARPLAETAAVLAAGGVATEVVHQATAEAAPPTPAAAPERGPTDDEGNSDDPEPEPAPHTQVPEPESHPESAPALHGQDPQPEPALEPTPAPHVQDLEPEPRPEPEPVLQAQDLEPEPAPEPEAARHEHEHETASPAELASPLLEDTTSAAEAMDVGIDDAIPQAKASGYIPMQPKPGAAQYQPGISVKFGRLPRKVDLRPLMTTVENQGDASSCVANAVASAYEYWIKKAAKQDANPSRLFVYYNARWRDDAQERDDGSVIQLAIDGLKTFGACPEAAWPFDKHLVLQKPGAEAYQDAAPFKVHDMARVPVKLEAWKQALAEGRPIVFGCLLFETFDDCSDRGGVVPMPSPEEAGRQTHGGHAMCAVGYCDSEKVFIVRNSWGADWGDKGYCYMPYAYLMNPKFNDGDSWVFVPKAPSQPPREFWSDDTAPVSNGGHGVDFPTDPYTIAQYESVAIDYFERWRKPFDAAVPPDFADYASLAGRGAWSEMESFDVGSFLATSTALTDISALVTSEFSRASDSAPESGGHAGETHGDSE